MAIPNDPVILLSYLNTKLRDEFSSLEELCKSLCLEEAELRQKLARIDYVYDEGRNQFI